MTEMIYVHILLTRNDQPSSLGIKIFFKLQPIFFIHILHHGLAPYLFNWPIPGRLSTAAFIIFSIYTPRL